MKWKKHQQTVGIQRKNVETASAELWIENMMHMCDVLAWKCVGISRINHSQSGSNVRRF